MLHLIRKYNKPTPRYTSYPTVPMWQESQVDAVKWKETVKRTFDESNKDGISLYLHLPYCEKLCTYCACNKRITTNHAVELTYIEALLKEWELYLDVFDQRPLIRELHLGGGTPTFFSPENLKYLLSSLLEKADIADDHAFSFEGHPNNTTYDHLKTLYDIGFKRVSFGIQDINEVVQVAINRIQPFYNVANVTQWAREIGYTSVNYDFVYGLPFQNSQNLARTLQNSLKLRPDRVAFYSYAHVPWTSKGQRAYSDKDLPGEVEKANMYLMGRDIFKEQGYVEIGMDHFALSHDELAVAKTKETLHRNFMGYTTAPGKLLLGLGCSSISDAHYGYAQNEKTIEAYIKAINTGTLPLTKGHFMSEKDCDVRDTILSIACKGKHQWQDIRSEELIQLKDLHLDDIISLDKDSFTITPDGMLFLRNVCAVFDQYLNGDQVENKFSKAI